MVDRFKKKLLVWTVLGGSFASAQIFAATPKVTCDKQGKVSYTAEDRSRYKPYVFVAEIGCKIENVTPNLDLLRGAYVLHYAKFREGNTTDDTKASLQGLKGTKMNTLRSFFNDGDELQFHFEQYYVNDSKRFVYIAKSGKREKAEGDMDLTQSEVEEATVTLNGTTAELRVKKTATINRHGMTVGSWGEGKFIAGVFYGRGHSENDAQTTGTRDEIEKMAVEHSELVKTALKTP